VKPEIRRPKRRADEILTFGPRLPGQELRRRGLDIPQKKPDGAVFSG